MSVDLNDAKTAISQIINEAARSGSNPWLAVLDVLRTQVEWNVSSAFRPQMHILSGVLALVTVILVASLVVRWYRTNFWLFRRTPVGIAPHYLTSCSSFLVIGLGCLQGFIWTAVHKSRHEATDTIVLWECLAWLPTWLAFCKERRCQDIQIT